MQASKNQNLIAQFRLKITRLAARYPLLTTLIVASILVAERGQDTPVK